MNLHAPEYRFDPIGGWRTILAPARSARPLDRELQSEHGLESEPAGGECDPDCPFCPGNESQLEVILDELPKPSGDGWGARAVANRFPFVAPAEAVSSSAAAGTPHAVGRQEVLIEAARHDAQPARMSAAELRVAVGLWVRRIAAVHRRGEGERAFLYRNQGREAGASRHHPHAQLVVLPASNPAGGGRPARMQALAAETGGCVLCAQEEDESSRTVFATEHFRAVTLAAPLDPAHLRIIPERHAPTVAGCSAQEIDGLAEVYGALAGALEHVFPGGAWNFMLHDLGPDPAAGLHWHAELRPRHARTAGFEQMTDIAVCSMTPEDAAHLLRAAL